MCWFIPGIWVGRQVTDSPLVQHLYRTFLDDLPSDVAAYPPMWPPSLEQACTTSLDRSPEGSDAQAKLLARLGRDPCWSP